MIEPLIPMRVALERPELFGGQLEGSSWVNWRAVLLAIAGEDLTPDEAAVVKHLSGRQKLPVGRPIFEFWGICGRRSGKSRAMALLTAWISACHDFRAKLAPGERGQIQVVSQSRDQAANLFRLIRGVFDASPAARLLVLNTTADTLQLSSRVDIVVRPASFRAVRGATCVAALMDEIAFWRTDDSANPDTEILRALRPSLATLAGRLVAISSPYSKRGEMWKAWRRHYSSDDSPVLCIQAESTVMNPGLDRDFIAAQYADDPESALAEYGAQFRGDITNFIPLEAIEACVEPGCFERAPVSSVSYHGFVDPSGGSADSMTLAVAHREGETIVLDAVRERKPPFSPEAVVEEFSSLLKTYRIRKVTGDRYAGEWSREPFRKRGIDYVPADKARSELYLETLPLINSRRVNLLDNRRLVSQFGNLERRVARSGRDSIDHAPNVHDDVANAAAGAIILASVPVMTCRVFPLRI